MQQYCLINCQGYWMAILLNIKINNIYPFIADRKNIYNLDGLLHDTFYHVRAKSRNKAGLSDASNIIYLHTTGLNAYPRLGLSSRASRQVSVEVIGTSQAVMLSLIWLLSMCTTKPL